MTDLRESKSTAAASPGGVDTGPADQADPLHNLYRMSRTAGLGSGDYVAINNVAIVALLLGLASLIAVLYPLMTLVAVAAIVCGVLAMIQIGSSNGTQTGRAFAILGVVLGLAFGGLAGGRVIAGHLEQRRDEEQIGKLVRRLGELIAAKEYTQAHQTLFSESFRRDFPEQEFQRRWESLVAYAGPVKSVGWGERAEFEYFKATETKRAAATSEVTFEKVPARQPITFVKVGAGEWEIDGINQLFEKPKEDQSKPAPMPDPRVPQGPQLGPVPSGPPGPGPSPEIGPGPA
jgi:hypothetical protein